eukprot:5812167-Pleurochrysis_carterae.AAC.1
MHRVFKIEGVVARLVGSASQQHNGRTLKMRCAAPPRSHSWFANICRRQTHAYSTSSVTRATGNRLASHD